jgi:hypothetical protein
VAGVSEHAARRGVLLNVGVRRRGAALSGGGRRLAVAARLGGVHACFCYTSVSLCCLFFSACEKFHAWTHSRQFFLTTRIRTLVFVLISSATYAFICMQNVITMCKSLCLIAYVCCSFIDPSFACTHDTCACENMCLNTHVIHASTSFSELDRLRYAKQQLIHLSRIPQHEYRQRNAYLLADSSCVYNMYVCMYVYIYICIYTYICIYMYTYLYPCIYLCLHACVYVYAHKWNTQPHVRSDHRSSHSQLIHKSQYDTYS